MRFFRAYLTVFFFLLLIKSGAQSTFSRDSLHIMDLVSQARAEWPDVNKTLQMCSQTLEFAEKTGDKALISRAYYFVGVINLELLKNYNRCIKYLIRSIDLCKITRDSVLMQRCYQTIGNSYSEIYAVSRNTADLNDAEKNLLQALKINNGLNKTDPRLTVFLANNLVNLSDLYLKAGNDSLSYVYAERSAGLYREMKNWLGLDLSNSNMCRSFLIKAKRSGRHEDYALCKKKYLDYYASSKISKQDDMTRYDSLEGGSKYWAGINLSEYYVCLLEVEIFLKEDKKAIGEYLIRAEFYSGRAKLGENLIQVYRLHSEYLSSTDPARSLSIKNKILKAQDSILLLEARSKNETLKAVYDYNQKESELELMAAENRLKDLEVESERQQSRIKTILLIIAILGAALIGFSLMSNLRLNKALKARNLLVNQQRELIEQKNKLITDGIEFSKVIQDEILFSQIKLNDLFSEHFLIYWPKDIVSGDFYFVRESGPRLLVAVVDCTGHGTSGAMMSLHANATLNSIIDPQLSKKSSQVLNALNEWMMNRLSTDEHTVKFGMDISLLIADRDKRTFSFSSTSQPLILDQNKRFRELKPVKATLGYSKHQYEEFSSAYDGSTRFYMFTDGFSDQRGGTGKEKFSGKRFRSLIEEIGSGTLPQQNTALDSAFKKWKGENRQTDDITVLAFSIK